MGGCTRVENGSSRRSGSAKVGIAPGAVNAAGTSARLSGRMRSAKARAGSLWGSLRRARLRASSQADALVHACPHVSPRGCRRGAWGPLAMEAAAAAPVRHNVRGALAKWSAGELTAALA
eukprot:5498810-Pleurochrysis_carterae.AAC.1